MLEHLRVCTDKYSHGVTNCNLEWELHDSIARIQDNRDDMIQHFHKLVVHVSKELQNTGLSAIEAFEPIVVPTSLPNSSADDNNHSNSDDENHNENAMNISNNTYSRTNSRRTGSSGGYHHRHNSHSHGHSHKSRHASSSTAHETHSHKYHFESILLTYLSYCDLQIDTIQSILDQNVYVLRIPLLIICTICVHTHTHTHTNDTYVPYCTNKQTYANAEPKHQKSHCKV